MSQPTNVDRPSVPGGPLALLGVELVPGDQVPYDAVGGVVHAPGAYGERHTVERYAHQGVVRPVHGVHDQGAFVPPVNETRLLAQDVQGDLSLVHQSEEKVLGGLVNTAGRRPVRTHAHLGGPVAEGALLIDPVGHRGSQPFQRFPHPSGY